LGHKKIPWLPDSASWVAGCAQACKPEVGVPCPRQITLYVAFYLHSIVVYPIRSVCYPSLCLNHQSREPFWRSFGSQNVTPTWNQSKLTEPYLTYDVITYIWAYLLHNTLGLLFQMEELVGVITSYPRIDMFDSQILGNFDYVDCDGGSPG